MQLRFEASGVPVFVQSDFTRTDPTSRLANYGYRIHIWIDEQLEDAKQLIENPDHEVKNPIDVQEFYALLNKQDEVKEAAYYKSEQKWLNWIFSIIAVGIVGWGIYAVIST